MMESLLIREPHPEDEKNFLSAMRRSEHLHHPWVKAPVTSEEFKDYLNRFAQSSNKSFLLFSSQQTILGVFNINEIVRGHFQSAYLGFYGVADFHKQGYMSAGLKLILKEIFTGLSLHRIEANIQPTNVSSINLVKNNGFQKEGYSPRYLNINNQWCDHERWALTVEVWRNCNV